MQHEQVFKDILAKITEDQELSQQFKDFQENFFNTFKIEKKPTTYNMAFMSFVFEYEINKKAVTEVLLEKAKELKEGLDFLKSNTYSAFEIVSVDSVKITATNLQTDQKIELTAASDIGLQPGQILFARYVEVGDEKRIIQVDGASPKEAAFTIKRALSGRTADISTIAVAPMLYPEAQKGGNAGNNTNPEKRLKKLLTKYIGKKLKWSEIKKLQEEKDEEKIMEMIETFCKKHKKALPANDLPTVKQVLHSFAIRGSDVDKGMTERAIVNAHMQDVRKNFEEGAKDGKFPSDEEVKEFQSKWYETPQKELGDRTPMQAVREERENAGVESEDDIIPPISYTQIAKDYALQKVFNEAKDLIEKDDISKAIDILEDASKESENHNGLELQLATCHLTRGHKQRDEADFDRAIQLFQKVLATDPNNEPAYKNLQIAHMLKSRLDMMRYEDEIMAKSDKDVLKEIEEIAPECTKQFFEESAKDAVSAWEIYEKLLNDKKIKTSEEDVSLSSEAEKLEVLLKVYWVKTLKDQTDFYSLENFVSEKLSAFKFESNQWSEDEKASEKAYEEIEGLLSELKEMMDKVEDMKRVKLVTHFLSSYAYDYMCRQLPENIITSYSWKEKRFALLDQLAEIWDRSEFVRQKAAAMIHEGNIEAGEDILKMLTENGDKQAKIVLATALSMAPSSAHKKQAIEVAKEIQKNHTEFKMSADEAKSFMKQIQKQAEK